MAKKFDIAGIGNACMDIVAAVDDALLDRFGLTKSVCTDIDPGAAQELYGALKGPAHIPGGCAANTAACMASLGNSTALLARAGGDALGREIAESMKAAGIYFRRGGDDAPELGSTRVFCLTTPDGHRTFAACYGAGKDIRESDLHLDILTDTKILYMDGFAFVSEAAHPHFIAAAQTAVRNGARIAFSPSDPTIVKKHAATVKAFLDLSHIYMSNTDEALAVTGAADVTGGLRALQKRGLTGFVTGGARGAWVFDTGRFYHILPATASKNIDTNGAGDHFAAGFLHGLLESWPLEKCGRLGALCAAEALTHPGARPVRPLEKLKEKL